MSILLRTFEPNVSVNNNFRNMSMALTFDTLAMIVDMLANGEPPDFATMQSMSQTCRHLLPVCRKHLFSAICLKFPDVDVSTPKSSGLRESILCIGAANLAKLIASSPEIAGYVRELVFYPHSSNHVDETLFPLLQKFDRLKKLHIRYEDHRGPWRRLESWDTLGDSLRVAIVNLIHRQQHTLTHLYFTDYLDIPISIIYPLTRLHTFHLLDSSVSMALVADPLVVCHSSPLQLKSLAFLLTRGAINGILEGVRPIIGLPIFDLSQLQHFSVMISSSETVDEGVPMDRLLPKMSQLKALNISVQQHSSHPNFPDILSSIHPEALVTLETLQFQTWYTHAHDENPDHHLPGAIMLNTPTFPFLKELIISLGITVQRNDPSPLVKDFLDLDNLLSTDKFSSLESLYLYLFFFDEDTDEEDVDEAEVAYDGPDILESEILGDIHALMPRSSMNPALKIVFSAPEMSFRTLYSESEGDEDDVLM